MSHEKLTLTAEKSEKAFCTKVFTNYDTLFGILIPVLTLILLSF
jgi:hypothetical protein